MRLFGWLGDGDLPARYDLRALGWEWVDLAVSPDQAGFPLLSTDPSLPGTLHSRRERAPVAMIGIADPAARASLLSRGFGEALPAEITLAELEERAARVAALLDALPRRRHHGDLRLELLVRDGWVNRRRLGLHPREFALLWRLAETPGEPVSPESLLSDVWQLTFRPETNSLAVHVCRLRAKLAVAGLPDVVRTADRGAYVLAPGPARSAVPLSRDISGLDDHVLQVASLDLPAGEEA